MACREAERERQPSKEWANDPARRQEAQIPKSVLLKTKVDLALNEIERAVAAAEFARKLGASTISRTNAARRASDAGRPGSSSRARSRTSTILVFMRGAKHGGTSAAQITAVELSRMPWSCSWVRRSSASPCA